jgi:hypothetical protein
MCAPQARRASRPVVLAASLLAASLLAAAAGSAKPPAADPPPAAPPLNPNPPTQVEFPPGRPEAGDADRDREAVSRFAWKLFVAVNWPARTPGPRGTPDPANPFRNTSGPTVWATWKAQEDLYPDDGKPKAWDEDDPVPSVAVFDQKLRRKQYPLQELVAPGADRVKVLGQLTAVNQAVFFPGGGGAPLVDQSGKVVRYEVRVNRKAYDTIFTRKLYLRDELNKLPANGGDFDVGSINIKAAWKELPNDPKVRERYYHTKAHVAVRLRTDQPPVMQQRVIGLVGLHVVARVEGRKSWVWSTFEHVDNLVPPPGAGVASFRNPASTDSDNTPRSMKIEPDKDFPTTPVQVGRTGTIHAGVKAANNAYRPLVAAPWNNYELVGVQWVREKKEGGALVDNGAPFAIKTMLPPRTEPVRNVTMETFHPDISCLQCHGPGVSLGVEPRRFPFVFYPDFMAIPQIDE